VLDLKGIGIAGAELDLWQNGDNRLYAVQDQEAPEDHLRGRFQTRADGTYAFLAVRPVPYTIPSDGPVGTMLDATGRHPWRPAHIHMIVRAPGYRTVATHIFDATSDYLASDAVFAVKPSLLRDFVPRQRTTPSGRTSSKASGARSRTTSCSCPARTSTRSSTRAARRDYCASCFSNQWCA
jgi:hydroxyquinol 1,2-dioxygenase